jgi:hypothetical protein
MKEQTELQSFALEKAGVKWMPAPGGMSDVERIGQALIRAKLLIRCDRLVKTIRPGKKKLSKFPARLVEYLVSVCVACPFPSNETLYMLSSIADSKCLKLCRSSDEDRVESCLLSFDEIAHVAAAVCKNVLNIPFGGVLTESAMLRGHTA